MFSSFRFAQTFINRIVSQTIKSFGFVEIEIVLANTMLDACTRYVTFWKWSLNGAVGYSPRNDSIRFSWDRGSSINWSPLTISNCSLGNTSSHLCKCRWYIDIASGRYDSLTVPFGRTANSSKDLRFFK